MSRFDHLEMGDPIPSKSEKKPEPENVDQFYYLERADRAFEGAFYEQALKYYSRSLEYDISLEDAWTGQIRCLIELGELQEAIIWSERALDRFPDSAQVLAVRAVAELRLGRSDAAIRFADAAISAKNVSPYVWVTRGEVMIKRNAVNARACFLKATELATYNPQVYAWIGRAYTAHNRSEEALEYLLEAVRLDPKLFICWYWIGNCYQALEETNNAKKAYQRALAANPAFLQAKHAAERACGGGIIRSMGRRLGSFLGLR